MYNPKQFRETNIAVMHDLMRDYPFASLITLADGEIEAHHLPLYLDAAQGEFGVLRGHVSKANPLCDMKSPGSEVLVIFRGPDAYITPSWYPTKQETGKVVPTWNYVVVHAHGSLRFQHEAGWIRRHFQEMTDSHEHGRAAPWQVSDAPEDYVEQLASGVVGVEIEIHRLEGKWKVSQNQPANNRQGVVDGLRQERTGCPMATLVEAYMQNLDS